MAGATDSLSVIMLDEATMRLELRHNICASSTQRNRTCVLDPLFHNFNPYEQ